MITSKKWLPLGGYKIGIIAAWILTIAMIPVIVVVGAVREVSRAFSDIFQSSRHYWRQATWLPTNNECKDTHKKSV